MGRFLRDEYIANLSIDEEYLIRLSDEFTKRADLINQESSGNGAENVKQQLVIYIIRFDNKGYRFHDLDEALRHYRAAGKVERIILCMESLESMSSNRMLGTHMEVRFDLKDPSNCFFSVSSESSDVVESSYSTLSDLLSKLRNKNGLIRNGWTSFLVQISGVVAGFIISLWAAIKISPSLLLESAFVVSFIFAFLVFSNVWTYLNPQILNLINYYFPNIRFERKGRTRLYWLPQTVVGGVVLAIVIFLLDLVFGWVGSILENYVVK